MQAKRAPRGRASSNSPAERRVNARPLEVWAGLECTLNRVGDTRIDQLALTGHYQRTDDVDRLADLGVTVMRYPILWERMGSAAESVWRTVDRQMNRMRERGIEPIVGLMHHGSGPDELSLLDEALPARLAEFARVVSARYPWVTRYTPVNEPLTTARFSALYGLWYPHLRSDAAFIRATLNQVHATRLAMEAIREHVPGAALVQTEDLGHTHAPYQLAYQARFENERRWLSFDLLTGRVTDGHRMHAYAMHHGVTTAEIERAVGVGCPPQLLGINHYITSERWLDTRLERYPQHTHGGNGRHRYADVEAVRALPGGVRGLAPLLVEAWQRYGIPIAVTEVHLGATREQQLRWLADAWAAAHAARASGADVRAATVWAAFGTFDWDSLVTRMTGSYESGVFDVRAPQPRRTALAAMTASLASGSAYDHPALDGPGWWQCNQRLVYCDAANATREATSMSGRPILIVGGAGTLGRALARICGERGLAHRTLTRRECDAAERGQVERALADTNAWAIVNASGYVRVDDAERDHQACHRANVGGAVTLAAACAERGIPLVTFSSDLVFDGCKGTPYVESDTVAPLCVYGRTKAEAESRVLEMLPSALVIRTAAFFGPWDDANFLVHALRMLRSGLAFEAAAGITVSPTYVPDLVHATLDLLIDGERGIWHLANAGESTWADFARQGARAAGLDPRLVHDARESVHDTGALRPRCSVLASERSTIMPPLEHAISRFVAARAWEAPSQNLEAHAMSAGATANNALEH